MINVDKIMKISNVRVYGMEESIIASGYPMQSTPVMDIDDMEEAHRLEVVNKGYKRARNLGRTRPMSSRSYAASLACRGVIGLLKNALGSPPWCRTAPKPEPDTPHSTVKTVVKSGS